MTPGKRAIAMRWNWGSGIALTYAVFALGTAGFVVFAMRQPVELVSADYYSQSQQYDRRIEARTNAERLGSQFGCAESADGKAVVLSLPAAQRATAHGTVTLYRPSDVRADRVIPLSLDNRGVQEIGLTGLAAGFWRMRVAWTANGQPFYYERPVEVR